MLEIVNGQVATVCMKGQHKLKFLHMQYELFDVIVWCGDKVGVYLDLATGKARQI